MFSLPECGRILAKYSFLVEFGGQIYLNDRDLVLLSHLQHPHHPGTLSAFAFSENSFAPRAPPFVKVLKCPRQLPGSFASEQCDKLSRCKIIEEIELLRLQILKRIGKFGSTLCCFGARSVR